jgi:hypothetical protein
MEEGKADANQQQGAGSVADDGEDADAPSGAVSERDSRSVENSSSTFSSSRPNL